MPTFKLKDISTGLHNHLSHFQNCCYTFSEKNILKMSVSFEKKTKQYCNSIQ